MENTFSQQPIAVKMFNVFIWSYSHNQSDCKINFLLNVGLILGCKSVAKITAGLQSRVSSLEKVWSKLWTKARMFLFIFP